MRPCWGASKLRVAGRLGKSKGNLPASWKKVAGCSWRMDEAERYIKLRL